MVNLPDEMDHFYIGLVYSPVFKLDIELAFFSPLYKRHSYEMVHFLAS